MSNNPSYLETVIALSEQRINESLSGQIATEAHGASFGNALSDAIGAVIGTVKANLSRKDGFRRSEWKVYYENHQRNLDAIFTNPRNHMVDILCPCPNGMVGNYKTTITELDRLYKTADYAETCAALLSLLTSIKESYDKAPVDAASKVESYLNKWHLADKTKDIETTLPKLFTFESDVMPRSSFKVFGENLQIVHEEMQDCLTFDTIFQDVMTQSNRTLPKIYKDVDNTVSHMQKSENKAALQEVVPVFWECVKQFARYNTKYGAYIHECQRVEHNFVLGIKTLEKAL